jgi:hypothetical protein
MPNRTKCILLVSAMESGSLGCYVTLCGFWQGSAEPAAAAAAPEADEQSGGDGAAQETGRLSKCLIVLAPFNRISKWFRHKHVRLAAAREQLQRVRWALPSIENV